jgi:hypothetical protein
VRWRDAGSERRRRQPRTGPLRAFSRPMGCFRPPAGRPCAMTRRHERTGRGPGVYAHACPQPGRARPGWRQRCRSAGCCIGERRVPLKAVAPVRIRSGLPFSTGVRRHPDRSGCGSVCTRCVPASLLVMADLPLGDPCVLQFAGGHSRRRSVLSCLVPPRAHARGSGRRSFLSAAV